MGYANPIEAMGSASFLEKAKAADIDGVIVVDYPPEECVEFSALAKNNGIDPVFLLAPTSTEKRIEEVARIGSGYLYYVSLRGVTGASHIDLLDVAARIPKIHAATSLPIGVGFGIRDAASARRGAEVLPVDTLKFKDSRRYTERLAEAQEQTAESDALVVMQGSIKALGVVCAAFEFDFMGGSMGSVVGERFVRGVRVAIEQKLPYVCVTASGGARMQEGLLSLVQMAKTTAALTDLAERRLPFISVLTDPTMGGVSASFAMIGDVVIAEPKALIGFAGPRVIEQTVRQKLPEGFQRAEFLLEKGAIDMIVDRRQLRDKLHGILSLLQGQPADNVA